MALFSTAESPPVRSRMSAKIDAMSDAAAVPTELPERIASRLRAIAAEVQKAMDAANQKIASEIPARIAFHYESAVIGRDILSDYERAQSVSFVTRFDHFPTGFKTHFSLDGKNWRIANLWDLRQALNDFRSVIQNQSDSVYYQNIHNTWYRAFGKLISRRALRFASWMNSIKTSPMHTRNGLARVTKRSASYLAPSTTTISITASFSTPIPSSLNGYFRTTFLGKSIICVGSTCCPSEY